MEGRQSDTPAKFIGTISAHGASHQERRLQQAAQELAEAGGFTGGPVEAFEAIGRLTFAMLMSEGLYPHSKLLDIGCGALRVGYWLIHFLDPHSYFGIEPNATMLKDGVSQFLEPGLVEAKQPSFDTNDRFDFSVFGERFDVVLARSVWTHAAKPHIRAMLDGFVKYTTPEAFFLTSYLPPRWLRHIDYRRPSRWLNHRDYKGDTWRGKSHTSTTSAEVHHSRKWVESECQARGLFVRELTSGVFNWQRWLKITKRPEPPLGWAFSRYRRLAGAGRGLWG
jgi:SAM-dependent methyltransferase